jgi:hypothetical protein
MPMTKIFDMAYEVSDGQVSIEQDAGCGEVNTVWLHPIHIRLLATELGMLRGDPDQARRVQTLERRMLKLRDRIEALDALLWSVPVYPPGNVTEDCMLSDTLLDLANEFCADCGNQDETHGQPATNPRDAGASGSAQGATPGNAKERQQRGEQLALGVQE